MLKEVQQKTSVKVDAALKKKVLAMADKESPEFKEAYRVITEYAKTIEAADNDYYVQPMQCFTAAWCATTAHDHVICRAAPAEGKTFSLLHFVRYKISQDNTGNTEAVVFCPTDMIAAQC